MDVMFKREFFNPKGNRMRPDIWHEGVDDDWKDILPGGAKIRDPDGEITEIPEKMRKTRRVSPAKLVGRRSLGDGN